MSRIQACFDGLRQRGRAALVPFITAGDPHPGATVALMHTLVEAGADILELGVPFSDPMADGPVIQRASERALKHHVSLRDVILMVRDFRATDPLTPVVLMGYLNPVEVMGYEKFVMEASSAGVDGVLTVDLPPEEAGPFTTLLKDRGMDPVFLFAPTTNEERAARICAAASGFVYYVSLKGVTGASTLNVEDVAEHIRQIRRHTRLPVGVGFGVKDADTATQLARVADAVVVGSALVSAIESTAGDEARMHAAARELIGSLRAGMDTASRTA
ncbi:MAG: Tryptophan synthase alpha chain [Gammaproteobacteria bacterium]|nr:Tryptophan synthase alpha chain [Gammaproteobacteria bacterium]